MKINKQSKKICLCPLEGTMHLIRRKWSLRIINEIGNHTRLRYSDLMSELKGISPSTLTSMLKDLEKGGIIKRVTIQAFPLRVEYSLLSRGRELRETIIPLLEWAKKNNDTTNCSCSLKKKEEFL